MSVRVLLLGAVRARNEAGPVWSVLGVKHPVHRAKEEVAFLF